MAGKFVSIGADVENVEAVKVCRGDVLMFDGIAEVVMSGEMLKGQLLRLWCAEVGGGVIARCFEPDEIVERLSRVRVRRFIE